MELKEFVKSVLRDVVDAVEEARTESARDMRMVSHKESSQTIEFDIAVTAEDTNRTSGKAGVHVLHLIEGSGDISAETKSGNVSRIKFGVYIDTRTKNEMARLRTVTATHNQLRQNPGL
jgi:predicted RNA-binding protein YlqC (UPF0109 family)